MAAPAGLGGGAAALLLSRGLVGELQRGDLVHDVVSVIHDGVGHDRGQMVGDCIAVTREARTLHAVSWGRSRPARARGLMRGQRRAH